MFAKLLALFIVIPLVDLAFLIEVGRRIGSAATVLLVILTGILGASLTRRQGAAVLLRARREMEEGRIPAMSLLEGVMILVAGVLLLTPGLITDAVGFALLIPAVRFRLGHALYRWLEDRFFT